MSFNIKPIEVRDGQWRVNWIPLVVWVCIFNLSVMAWLGHMIRMAKHPVLVTGRQVPIYSMATDTARDSHIVGTVSAGNTVNLDSIQADGWCRVSLPEAGFPPLNGYVQQQFLSIPEATQKELAAQQQAQ